MTKSGWRSKPVTPEPGHETHRPSAGRHGATARSRRRLPLGRGADLRHHRPYTIEEAYEVADAIERNDLVELKGELGDLLFQVVFHARMAEEQGLFAFDDVAAAIADKLERRHPHVFGTESQRTSKEQTVAWETIKAAERKDRQKPGVLDDVPVGLPP